MCSGAASSRFVTSVFALFVLCLTWTVAADEKSDKVPRAEELFQEANKLLDEEKWDEACEKLAESQRLDPAGGTLGLLAYCHEKQGRTATAWREYREAAEMATKAKQRDRARVAKQRARALKPKLSFLRIKVPTSVEGLVVKRGDETVPPEEFDQLVAIDPGRIVVQAEAPGYRVWTQEIKLEAGAAQLEVTVPELLEEDDDSPAPVAPVVVVQKSAPEPPWYKKPGMVPGLILTGVGVVGLGVGSYFGLQAINKNGDSEDHCDATNACDAVGGDLRDDAKTSATISTVAFGVGAAATVTGVILMVVSGGSSKERASAFQVAPSVTAGQAEVRVQGWF